MPTPTKRKVTAAKPNAKSTTGATSSTVESIIESAKKGELVVVMGAGLSVALTNGKIPSWQGLVRSGFEYGVRKGKISPVQEAAWGSQLESTDIDDLLSAAEFMERKLGGCNGTLFSQWLKSVFKDAQVSNAEMADAVKLIQLAKVPICTLNYDHLLELVNGVPPITMAEPRKVTAWMRREAPGILHLHGSWDQPEGCVLGIVDYESTVNDTIRNLIQRTLGVFKRLLFVGCGDTFADPNFGALVSWLRSNMSGASLQHYALVSDKDIAKRDSDPTWHGFVEPLSYGASHDKLPAFLNSVFSRVRNATSDSLTSVGLTTSPQHAVVLEAYRSFVLRDCGEMAIEGVRADMDTAQRKFDLERLFVPLELVPVRPDILEHDPKYVEKMEEWRERTRHPSSFGSVFESNSRLALLALPGGGKTVLLKRLAVAYTDPSRRKMCDDSLPDLNLTPIVIRCRDWRERIRRPLLTMLQDIAEITGQPQLIGFAEAIVPLLRKGQVLLLIDGLDEIHDDADRTTFVSNLEAFIEEYKDIRLVVTSREAGFSLVAPTLSRFCRKWSIAPLNAVAIRSLCDFWHILMSGDSLESRSEGAEVADRIFAKDSLHRLAETPLLLTMLLVVKNGFGRLPPDRVSLYERAVEVLLDTWNIRGHKALDPKEAVPQLAFVAFRMMCSGKQRVTEDELHTLLLEAREKVPQINLYAKDTPREPLI